MLQGPLAAIALDGVSKTYRTREGDVPSLRPVALEIARGEVVAVVGPSGCGKSTLLHLMGAVDRATGGRVTIDGRDVGALGDREATAFRLYGVRSGALCVALGNYHNLGPDRRIEPEYVSVADVEGLYTLCLRLAELSAARRPDLDAAVRALIEKRLLPYQPYHQRDRLPASIP